MGFWFKHGRRLIGLTLVLMLAGCGSRFFYNHLDTFARWKLDDYVSLEDGQSDWLKRQLASELQWHRRQELPRYVTWLKDLRRDVDGGLDRAAIDRHFERFYGFRQSLAEHMLPAITEFLAGLSDEQVAELFENLEEDNQDYADDYVEPAPEKQLKKRMKDFGKTLRSWVGKADDEQRERVEIWARQVQTAYADQLDYQRDWQKALREALAYRQERERFAARLKTLFLAPESLRTPAFQKKVEHNIDSFRSLLLDLDRSLSPEQKRHLLEEIDDAIGLCEKLIG